MEYKYFSKQRPLTPGACPKDNILEIVNFEDKTYCTELCDEAWGFVIYDKELSKNEIESFDLTEVLTQKEVEKNLEEVVNKLSSKFELKTDDSEESYAYYFKMPPSCTKELLHIHVHKFFARKLRQKKQISENQLNKFNDFINEWISHHCYLEKN